MFNCVAGRKIFDETRLKRFSCSPRSATRAWPPAGFYYVHHQVLGQPRSFVMENAYWGPGYSPEQVRSAVAPVARREDKVENEHLKKRSPRKPPRNAAGKILGWFQGRAEWGPRAREPQHRRRIRAART